MVKKSAISHATRSRYDLEELEKGEGRLGHLRVAMAEEEWGIKEEEKGTYLPPETTGTHVGSRQKPPKTPPSK